MKVSVVVATYKRPEFLSRCLQALVNQSVLCKEYEIVIISDGPDNKTECLLNNTIEQFHHSPEIRFHALEDKKGPAAARNAGWKMAKADLILFTDDDCIPS